MICFVPSMYVLCIHTALAVINDIFYLIQKYISQELQVPHFFLIISLSVRLYIDTHTCIYEYDCTLEGKKKILSRLAC